MAMTVKTITYTDFDGLERTEKFFFNLTQTEITEWDASIVGGLRQKIEEINEKKSIKDIVELVRDSILRSYGVKSPDGRRFVKSGNVATEFYETPAYDQLFMSFVENPATFADFLRAIIPPEALKENQPVVALPTT